MKAENLFRLEQQNLAIFGHSSGFVVFIGLGNEK
jgi:hypothetical protein